MLVDRINEDGCFAAGLLNISAEGEEASQVQNNNSASGTYHYIPTGYMLSDTVLATMGVKALPPPTPT